LARPTIPPPSQGFDYYEPAVQLAMRDFVRPGNLVFDVGANIGGIAVVASRLVGSLGSVVAIEPSMRVLPELITNIQSWRARNVTIDVRAAWSQSDASIGFYHGWSHVADSAIINLGKEKPDQTVTTVALDDLVAEQGRAPQFVKFDVEGAEGEALKGFEKTIAQSPPVIVVEMNVGDHAFAQKMVDYGYTLFDTSTYRQFEADPTTSRLCNLLALPNSRAGQVAAMKALRPALLKTLTGKDWIADSESPCLPLGELPSGRYVLKLKHLAPNEGAQEIAELVILTTDPARMLSLHIAPWREFIPGNLSHPFNISRPGKAFLRIKRRTLQQVNEMIEGVELYEIKSSAMKLPWRSNRLLG